MRRPVRVVTVAGLALLSACSPTTTPSPQRPPSAVSSPLADSLLETPETETGTRASEQEAYDMRRNEIIAECMREAGFEYVPYQSPASPQVALGLSDEEFVRAYGFGISTLIDYAPPVPATSDPNDGVRDALSESARRSYDSTMLECELLVTSAVGLPPDTGRAYLPPAVAAMQDEALDLMFQDPRVREARDEALRCMAEQGFEGGDELSGEIADRTMPFAQRFQQGRDKLVSQGHDPATVRVEDVLTPAEVTELAEIQQSEITVAVANFECSEDYLRLQDAVYREYLDELLNGRG
ncbi:MAG: hypothetical protein ACRDQ7_06085 [Haloechinothrix sp.]